MTGAMLIAVAVGVVGCGWRPAAPPAPPEDHCTDSDGPTFDTVRRAVAAAGAGWTETARGHTRNCRLHWVKLGRIDAVADSPEQLLFFDRGTPLGSPTPDPRPYITVLPATTDTVIVQYQWRVGDDPACCPTGIATTRYRIGPHGKLEAG